MSIKCILFDADGVLIHSEMFSFHYEREVGLPKKTMQPFFSGVFRDCTVGKADLKEAIMPYLKEWKWEKSVEEFLQYWFDVENQVDEQVVNMIRSLRKSGTLCFLASNNEKYRTEYTRHTMGFGELFDGIFSSAEIGYKKPDRKFYEYVLNELKQKHGIEKEEVAYVDDTIENIEGAKEVGIESHLYVDFALFEKFLNEHHPNQFVNC